MPNGICSAGGCPNEGVLARGYCDACYQWSRRNGGADPSGRRRTRSNGAIIEALRSAAQATDDQCVMLTGFTRRPKVSMSGKQIQASRAVWILANGDPGEAHVLHTCHRGDEGCVNIRHLYLGDNDQNIRDMISADRHSRGARRWSAKLDDATVAEIRRTYAAGGISYAALGARFNVSESTVHRVVTRKGWKHV